MTHFLTLTEFFIYTDAAKIYSTIQSTQDCLDLQEMVKRANEWHTKKQY